MVTAWPKAALVPGVPLTVVLVSTRPFIMPKVVLADAPPLVAVTVTTKAPAVAFEVNVGAVARPVAPLVVENEVRLPGKVPLGPLVGALKTTVAPAIVF